MMCYFCLGGDLIEVWLDIVLVGCGVYVLFGECDEVLYVGCSVCVW